MTLRSVAVSAVLSLVFSAGCEHSESAKSLSWEQERQQQAAAQASAPKTSNKSSAAPQSAASSSSSASAKTPASSSAPASTAAPASTSSSASVAAGSGGAAPSAGETGAGSGGETPSETPSEAPAAADQVPFGSLKWRYGGVNGSGARASGVAISSASFSSGGMSFKYVRDLSAWGYSSGALGGYACLFVQNQSGAWVGGKFDWISSSRKSRDFKNVYGGYAGWSLADVPNPCNAAFVIISPDAKKRSNVIVGTWSR